MTATTRRIAGVVVDDDGTLIVSRHREELPFRLDLSLDHDRRIADELFATNEVITERYGELWTASGHRLCPTAVCVAASSRMEHLGRFHLGSRASPAVRCQQAVEQAAFEELPAVLNRHGVACRTPARSDLAIALRDLYPVLRHRMLSDGTWRHLVAVEMPAIDVMCRMSARGVRVDISRVRAALAVTDRHMAEYETRLRAHGVTRDENGNLDASELHSIAKRVDAFLGKGLLRVSELERCRDAHPALDLAYLYERRFQQRLNFLRILSAAGADGRIHPDFDSLGAVTGRITETGAAVSTIGRIFRPVVIPDTPDDGLIELDFSSLDPYVAGLLAHDAALCADYASGDLYAQVDARLGLGLGRERMKGAFLGWLYGMEGGRLGQVTGSSLEGGQEIRARLDQSYPAVVDLRLCQANLLEWQRYVALESGLRRYRGHDHHRPLAPFEARWAFNTLVQGTGAVILKRSMPMIERALAPLGGRLVLTLHDSVLVQAPRTALAAARDATRAALVGAFLATIPGASPRLKVNEEEPSCWNDDGDSGSIEKALNDPDYGRRVVAPTDHHRLPMLSA